MGMGGPAPTPNMVGRSKLRRAADRLLTGVLEDAELVEILVEQYVREAIERGELVRTESLTLGAGAQVVQTADLLALRARLEELEMAVYNAQVRLDEKDIDGAVYYLDQVRPPEDEVVDAEVATDDEAEDEVVDAEVVEDEEPEELPALGAGAEPDPAPEAAEPTARPGRPVRSAPARPTGGGEGPVELESNGRPRGMPDRDRTHPCERVGCKEKHVPGDQAQISWTRFRTVLCRADMVKHKPPIGQEPPAAEAS